MEFKGKCIIFSAPSGAGKTTIVHHLLQSELNLKFSVSATSRNIRENEKDGEDYHFLSLSEFKQNISDDKFIEWEEVYTNNFYGTLKSEIERIWERKAHVIFDVDVVGGMRLKNIFGEKALSVFVQAPSIKELELRLLARKSETVKTLKTRIEKAEQEMKFAKNFDVVLVNDILSEAKAKAVNIVRDFLENKNTKKDN